MGSPAHIFAIFSRSKILRKVKPTGDCSFAFALVLGPKFPPSAAHGWTKLDKIWKFDESCSLASVRHFSGIKIEIRRHVHISGPGGPRDLKLGQNVLIGRRDKL